MFGYDLGLQVVAFSHGGLHRIVPFDAVDELDGVVLDFEESVVECLVTLFTTTGGHVLRSTFLLRFGRFAKIFIITHGTEDYSFLFKTTSQVYSAHFSLPFCKLRTLEKFFVV